MTEDISRAKRALFLSNLPDHAFAGMLPAPPPYTGPQMDRNKVPRIDPINPDEAVAISKKVLAWSEDFWGSQLNSLWRREYKEPALVLYSGTTQSGCGTAMKQMGPFYCPLDGKVYLDPTFFGELRQRFWIGTNEMSVAYVIFHEVSHHVQKTIGVTAQKDALWARTFDQTELNIIMTALELQAEFFTGAAIHGVNLKHRILHVDDPDTLYWTALSIGDDAIQFRHQGRILPQAFTHGTSAQRAQAIRSGMLAQNWKDGADFLAFVDFVRKERAKEMRTAQRV